MELQGQRVMVLAENDYEDLELWYPKLRLIEAGARVTVAGPGEAEYKSKHGYPAKTDGAISAFDPGEFDALVVPGGWAPDRLRRYEAILQFTRAVNARGAVVAAICHAGWVLVSADIVRGKRLTSVAAIKDDLKNAGAEWVDEPCVVDGNLVTAQVPKDLPDFCREIISVMKSRR
jgi:protease I